MERVGRGFMQHLIHLFWEQIKATTWLEWLAVFAGMAEVLLAKKNNIWLYPSGLISIIAGTYLLMESKLYAESILNVYYFIMSVYGWVHWLKRRNEPPVKISNSSKQEWGVTLAITFAGWALLYVLLKHFTNSNVPIWDSFVSSSAWAGMWLLARRKTENWVLLNLSNLFAIPLLFYKQLPLMALLTLFLFIVAIFGYIDWLRILKKDKAETIRISTVS